MNRKKFVFLLLIIVLIINAIFLFFKPELLGNSVLDFKGEPSFESGFVTKVIDGDTVVINGESVRLLGMDTPERGEKCYSESTQRLKELVLNKDVLLESDVSDKDQYKRLLRYVFIEENGERINVNILLVREGFATARFYEDRKYRNEILVAEKEARENKIGCKWN